MSMWYRIHYVYSIQHGAHKRWYPNGVLIEERDYNKDKTIQNTKCILNTQLKDNVNRQTTWQTKPVNNTLCVVEHLHSPIPIP